MKEDYLWDKTGEPDPEIQQLEEILGTLRYQPKPLEIPQELLTPRRRWNQFPVLAIAASILLALLAAGVWLRVRTRDESQPHQANSVVAPSVLEEKKPAVAVNKNKEGSSNEQQARTNENQPSRNEQARNNEQVRKGGLSPLPRHTHRIGSPALAGREREEALAAKEQLMLALRLTSEKLSLVHRKTAPTNQIKNQHRVG